NSVRAAFWTSDAGLLVYFSNPLGTKRPVVWMSRDGKQMTKAAPEAVYTGLSLAPGAERIALMRTERAGPRRRNLDILLREFARGVMTRLTFGPAEYRSPVWSPDGKYVAFVSDRNGSFFQIYRKESSDSGSKEVLTEEEYSKYL